MNHWFSTSSWLTRPTATIQSHTASRVPSPAFICFLSLCSTKTGFTHEGHYTWTKWLLPTFTAVTDHLPTSLLKVQTLSSQSVRKASGFGLKKPVQVMGRYILVNTFYFLVFLSAWTNPFCCQLTLILYFTSMFMFVMIAFRLSPISTTKLEWWQI